MTHFWLTFRNAIFFVILYLIAVVILAWVKGAIDMNKCGECQHSRSIPDNLQQRVCKGAPPQIVPLPTGMGMSIKLQHIWPTVMATDEGCGMFRSKVIVDNKSVSDVKL